MDAIWIADVLALGLVGGFALRGFQRGALVSLLSLGGVVFAYAGALLLSEPVAEVITGLTGWPKLYSQMAGGAIVFMVVSSTLKVAVNMMLKRRKRAKGKGEAVNLGPVSRFGGAGMGFAAGLIIMSLMHWGIALARGMERFNEWPDVGAGVSGEIAGAIVEGGARAVMDENSARLVSHPDDTARLLRELLALESVRELMGDAAFREFLLAGDAEGVAGNESYRALFEDPEAVDRLVRLGAVEANVADADTELAGTMAETGGRLGGILENPDVEETVAELREEGMLKPENWPRLVFDARFVRIMETAMTPAEDT